MAWWIDRPLLKVLTRGWGQTEVSDYSDRICKHRGLIPAPILASMQDIDSKATGLLTHVSMMIAGLGLIASLIADHRIEEGIIILEITVYLLLAIGCLRCLNVLNPPPAVDDTSASLVELSHELVLRRQLYALCVHATTWVTVFIIISLPAMYFL
jgi:hypothetical protein